MTWRSRYSAYLPPLWVLTLFLIFAFIWLLVALKEIVFLLVISFAAAYLMQPALKKMEDIGIRRAIGVLLIYATIVVFLILMTLTAIPTFSREYSEISANFSEYVLTARDTIEPYIERFQGVFPTLNQLLEDPLSALSTLPKPSSETVSSILGTGFSALTQGYSVTLTIVNLFLLPFLVFYMAIEFPSYKEHFLKLFPILMREKVQKILCEIDVFISAFVRGQMLVGLILTCLFALGLGFLGVELWFFLAVISGFGNMIPYLGTIVGVVLSTIMALVTFKALGPVFAVWGVFAVVQALEGNLITPRVIGEKVGLSPLVILLALLAGGSLFGLLGIVLAVPGVAVIRVLGKYFLRWYVQQQ